MSDTLEWVLRSAPCVLLNKLINYLIRKLIHFLPVYPFPRKLNSFRKTHFWQLGWNESSLACAFRRSIEGFVGCCADPLLPSHSKNPRGTFWITKKGHKIGEKIGLWSLKLAACPAVQRTWDICYSSRIFPTQGTSRCFSEWWRWQKPCLLIIRNYPYLTHFHSGAGGDKLSDLLGLEARPDLSALFWDGERANPWIKWISWTV